MTGLRSLAQFTPINSTAPGIDVTFDNTSTNFALEATGVREWEGPTGRAIRLGTKTASEDFHFILGDSGIVAASSEGTLVLGGTVESFHPIVTSGITHIACVSSTDVTLNITLGYGR